MDAEQEAARVYRQMDKLKKKHAEEISVLNELIAKTRLPEEDVQPPCDDSVIPTYDDTKMSHPLNNQFESFYYEEDGELEKLAEQSPFSGYDRCNI